MNGVAAGAGFGFALAADYRVVADTAAFNTSFAGVALTADSGISWTLPRVIGPGRAADLLLFPRSITAQEAYELGIANRLVPAGRAARRGREGGAGAGRGADGGVRGDQGVGGLRAVALPGRDPGEGGRAADRAGASEDHAIAVQAFVEQGEAEVSGAVSCRSAAP